MSDDHANATTSIEDLCDRQTWSPGHMTRFFYMPVGLFIATIRLFALGLIQVLSWVPLASVKRDLFRILLRILGIRIRYNLSETAISELTNGCVIAANHISLLDSFLVLALPHATIMVGNPASKTNPLSVFGMYAAFKCSGAKFWRVTERRAFAEHLARWRMQPHGVALYTTPEMTINNGKGLFKFNPAFLSYKMPVVPLALRLTTPLGLNPHPLLSSGGAIFFRLLMMPRLNYELTYLQKLERKPEQTKQMFADEVQHSIAQYLGIPATQWTVQDKHALRRRVLQASHRQSAHE